MKTLLRKNGRPFTCGFSGKIVVDIFLELIEWGADFRQHFLGVEKGIPLDPGLYSLIPDNVILNILIIVSVH